MVVLFTCSARNKSIINDLFHGQLKSKVTCKVCGHESVKFDPFTSLSLPLPMDTSVHLEAIGEIWKQSCLTNDKINESIKNFPFFQ